MERALGMVNGYTDSAPAVPKFNLKKFLRNGPPPGPLSASAALYFPDVEFRPVKTIDELEKASHLVYDEYVGLGYIQPNRNALKVSLYHVLPATTTFVALHRAYGILATLTIIPDSPLGLPMDKMYWEELNPLRLAGCRLYEISMLALNRSVFESGVYRLTLLQRMHMLCHLFRCIYEFSRMETDLDAFVECCHPRHDGFYETIGLKRLGGLRSDRDVNGSPALARLWDVREAARLGRASVSYRITHGELPAAGTYANRLRYSLRDIDHLFIRHSNILASATADKLSYIQRCYPAYKFDRLLKSKDLITYLIEAIDAAKNPALRPIDGAKSR